MALLFVPSPGTLLMCDFDTGFQPPEMTKRRPVVVVSPRRRRAMTKLCTVVPLSTAVPNQVEPFHHRMNPRSVPVESACPSFLSAIFAQPQAAAARTPAWRPMRLATTLVVLPVGDARRLARAPEVPSRRGAAVEPRGEPREGHPQARPQGWWTAWS